MPDYGLGLGHNFKPQITNFKSQTLNPEPTNPNPDPKTLEAGYNALGGREDAHVADSIRSL